MKIKNEKGITLITLATTITLLIIIATISLKATGTIDKLADDSILKSELQMVQHAILEEKTKSKFINEELPGTNISKEAVQNIVTEINSLAKSSITLKGEDGDYKELNEIDLKALGITEETDTYIVNYKTGEVINKTQKVTNKGNALYTYSIK